MSQSAEVLVRDSSNSFHDANIYSENRNLKARMKQLQADLQYEQATVASIRKKCGGLEKERMDLMSKYNEDVSNLEGEVAKLRSQLEKGEATRHSLEFELTKLRRDMAHEKRFIAERDAAFTEARESLKAKMSEMSDELSRSTEEVEQSRLRHGEEKRKLQATVTDKEFEITRLHNELDNAESEKENLQRALNQAQEKVHTLDDKVVALTEAKRDQGDELRRLHTDHTHLECQHTTVSQDLEVASGRIKQLEINVEAERSAHLESKFNTEIIQLRLRDLEGALELEKNTKIEVLTSSDKLNKQIRYCEMYHGDLQRIYDEERRVSQETKDKLEKAEKEYSSLSKQLNAELDEKRKVIKNLSEQLEHHQKDFTELKQELSKTKRNLTKMESSQNSRLSELEDIYNNFRFDQPRKPCRKMASKQSDSKSRVVKEPDTLLDNIKDTMLAYRKKLSEAGTEVSRIRQQFDSTSTENRRLNESVVAKDRALRNTQSGMNEARLEMNVLQRTNRELERDLSQIQKELEETLRQYQAEQRTNLEIADQSSRLLKKTNTLEQKLAETLLGIYQQLNPETDRSTLTTKSADELLTLITDQVNKVRADIKWMAEKIEHLEVTVSNKSELVDQLQEAHDDQLERLGELAEGRSMQWQQHRAQLEEHYTQLVNEIQGRHKKTQALADQAWEKVRMTGTVQQGLERECEELRAKLQVQTRDQKALLAACALLVGALLPLKARNSALIAQKDLMSLQLQRLNSFKKTVQELSESFKLEQNGMLQTGPASLNLVNPTPIIRFRRAVIAVMAAHRLLNMSRGSCRMFVSEGQLGQLVVCTGGVRKPSQAFTGFGAHRSQYNHFNVEGETGAAAWLKSEDLKLIVQTSLGEVVNSLAKVKDNAVDTPTFTKMAQNSFQQLLGQLTAVFHGVPGWGSGALALKERNSLIRRVGQGLGQAICGAEEVHKFLGVFEPTTITAATLQHHMLDFTRRLHTAEVERRDLRIQVTHLSQGRQQANKASSSTDQLVAEKEYFKKQAEDGVERARFQQVCDELNKALQRERDAQQLLKEQAQQIIDLQGHIRSVATFGSSKEQSINNAVASLAEAQMELKRQEQKSGSVQQALQEVEGERDRLQEHVKDAENALRTAARDKESLSTYIKAVTTLVNELQAVAWQAPDVTIDFTQLTAVEQDVSLAPGRKGPELASCQQLVQCLSALGQQVTVKLEGLKQEMLENMDHIERLKAELLVQKDGKQAQYTSIYAPEHGDSIYHDVAMRTTGVPQLSQSEEFLPMQEDHELGAGFSSPQMSTLRPSFPDPDRKYISRQFRQHMDPRMRSIGIVGVEPQGDGPTQ